MKIYIANFLYGNVNPIVTTYGDILRVEAQNEQEATRKICNYIKRFYKKESKGYQAMENPEKYNFSVTESTIFYF